jgi:hypothetical protein
MNKQQQEQQKQKLFHIVGFFGWEEKEGYIFFSHSVS